MATGQSKRLGRPARSQVDIRRTLRRKESTGPATYERGKEDLPQEDRSVGLYLKEMMSTVIEGKCLR